MIDGVPKTILVVDDTKSIREIVAFMLRGRGYEVLEAADGQEAREKIKAHRPDLVLLDAMLPKVTGFDLCAEMKADEDFKSMPILMLTAITKDSGKTDEYWREKSQADDFMSKPFKAQDLVSRVEKLLAARKPSAEA